MTRSLNEIAADLRQRVIKLDGLGDFGTARAEDAQALAHDLDGTIAILQEVQAADVVRDQTVGDLIAAVEGVVKRLERLERVYLPTSQQPQ